MYPPKLRASPHAAPASAATEGHHLASHLTGSVKTATQDAVPTLMAKPKTLTDKNRPMRIDVFSLAVWRKGPPAVQPVAVKHRDQERDRLEKAI